MLHSYSTTEAVDFFRFLFFLGFAFTPLDIVLGSPSRFRFEDMELFADWELLASSESDASRRMKAATKKPFVRSSSGFVRMRESAASERKEGWTGDNYEKDRKSDSTHLDRRPSPQLYLALAN